MEICRSSDENNFDFLRHGVVSPKFPYVPLGVGGGLWAMKNEGVGLIVVQLVSKISNLCGLDPPTLQTDGRTDDMQSQYRSMPL